MAQQTVLKRSAAAPVINTDTPIFTPASGIRTKILAFWVSNEVAAQAAGMNFELRFGSNIIAIVGFNSAAAPIGQTSQIAVLAHEIIGDGVTPVQARNLTALAATTIAAYVVAYDANYAS
jgi:hypothetical protein